MSFDVITLLKAVHRKESQFPAGLIEVGIVHQVYVHELLHFDTSRADILDHVWEVLRYVAALRQQGQEMFHTFQLLIFLLFITQRNRKSAVRTLKEKQDRQRKSIILWLNSGSL